MLHGEKDARESEKMAKSTFKENSSGENLPNIKIADYKKFDFKNVDLIFSCLPHGKFQKEIFPKLSYNNAIIDLSGDFRIDNQKEYEKYYECKHKSFLHKKKFVYGLTEINREKIKSAKFVSNPDLILSASFKLSLRNVRSRFLL